MIAPTSPEDYQTRGEGPLTLSKSDDLYKIDAFADLMRPLGLQEMARTGVAALLRGE